MQNQIINLNLIPGGTNPIVNASQYDEGRTFQFLLWDGDLQYTIPNNATVKINGIKPDRHGFSYLPEDGAISIDEGRHSVTVTTLQQMTCVYGSTICEIVVAVNDHDIGSANFILEVEEAPVNDSTIVSDTDLPAIITEAEEQAERAEAAAASVAEAADFIREHEEDIANAATYAADAHRDATAAALSATNAAGSATSASTSATNAASSATSAGNSATAAATSETNATNAATAAGTSETNARNSATTASTAATNAASSETNAANSATAAAGSATAAATSATNAVTAETGAAGSATAAGNSATAAAGSATAAADSAEDSEAWAVGERSGTPVPYGDETYHNNAKYWADQASHAAGGGVTSFNGRNGIVTPESGDYTAAMVGALPTQTGTQGQLLGFVDDDVVGAVNAPATGVTTFNGRTGVVSPANGDYTAAMVGALPTQTGTQGQLLGFTADNVVGAVNPPATGVTSFGGRTGAVTPQAGDYNAAMVGALPTQTGTAGQVLGFTATDTVGAINPPQPTYTGSQGQVLGFTDVNTVGAKNPTALFTGTTGQVLGFTGTNTVGALDSGAQYIEAYSSVYTPMFPPYPGETTASGTCHSYGYTTVDRTGLWKIVVTNNARFTKDGLVKFQFALGKNTNTDSEVIYERTFFVPGNMSLVDSFNTDVKDVLLLPLKAGTTLWFDGYAVPQSGGISEYTGSSYVAYYMIEF